MSSIELFQEEHPSRESYWRSIVLFGTNSSTYKFALAKSLIECAKNAKDTVSLQDLAEPFARAMCNHVAEAPRQATGKPGPFIEACRKFNADEIDKDELISSTIANGFNCVLDKFHNVNRAKLPIKFYEVSGSRNARTLTLTDETFWLMEGDIFGSLDDEAEARWNLVQLAWDTNIAANLLDVKYDHDIDRFFVNDSLRRRDVTSARDALNGYQKGRCFYCYDIISLDQNDERGCDVDHFFPHMLNRFIPNVNLNGVWNLVLSCRECNRGQGGKFERIPKVKYLERLSKRNEFLISSHHPLRETIMAQTGPKEIDRRLFLKKMNHDAINYVIQTWETKERGEALF